MLSQNQLIRKELEGFPVKIENTILTIAIFKDPLSIIVFMIYTNTSLTKQVTN